MALDDFVDLAKNYFLYESQRGGSAELMLQRTATNSRVNEGMAQFTLAFGKMTHNWKGHYKDLWGDQAELQEHYLNMEAFGRKQAIELAAAVARANAPIASDGGGGEKSGGIFGLFKH